METVVDGVSWQRTFYYTAVAVVWVLAGCGDSPASSSQPVAADTQSTASGDVADTTDDQDTGLSTGSDTNVSDTQKPPPEDTSTGLTDTTEPPCTCDDLNECTVDSCQPDGSCVHVPADDGACAPTIKITSPERGATLYYAGQPVDIVGETQIPLPPLEGLTLNEIPQLADGEGAFTAQVVPAHGVNRLSAEVGDSSGGISRTMQSFLIGEAFYPTGEGPSEEALVGNGLLVFLGKELIDDDDPSDLDDLAGLAQAILEGADVVQYLPQPLSFSKLTCTWNITVNSITYEVVFIDISPVEGGLQFKAELKDLVLDFYAEASFCPDAGGTGTTDKVAIDAFVGVKMNGDGSVSVTLDPEQLTVEVEPPVFDLDQGLASSFDWLINWFNGTMADAIEEAVEETINGQLAPTVKLLFESLSDYEETFEVPPFLGATQAVPVGVKVQPAFLSLDPTGGLAALSVSASAQKGPSWLTSPGSLAREGCLDSVETSVDLPTDAPLVMAIHDDVVNQGLFGAWWGGVLHVTVDESLLTTLEVELPIDEIDAQLDPMLPPVLTSCTSNGKPQLHVGDLRILTTFLLNGELAAVEAYASAAFEVEMTAAAAPGATIDLGLGLQNVVWLDFELVSVSGAIQGRQDILQVLIEGLVSEVLANALSNGVFQQFPVPQLAIGTFVPGLPANAALGFIPESLVRKQGYTILSGKVAQN